MKNRLGQLRPVDINKDIADWTGFDHLQNFIFQSGYDNYIQNKLDRINNRYRREITWNKTDVKAVDEWYSKIIDLLVEDVKERKPIDKSIFVDLDKSDDNAIK